MLMTPSYSLLATPSPAEPSQDTRSPCAGRDSRRSRLSPFVTCNALQNRTALQCSFKRFDRGIELLCNVHSNVSIAGSNRFDSEINWLDSRIELLRFEN